MSITGFMTENEAEEVLKHIFAAAAMAKGASCYLALCVSEPGANANSFSVKASEVKTAGYKRFKIEVGTAAVEFGKAAGKAFFKNKEELEIIKELTGTEETVAYWVLVESTGEGKTEAEELALRVTARGAVSPTVGIGSAHFPVKVAAKKLVVEAI